MKIYIAGKITGDPNYRRKFSEAAFRYTEGGKHVILNPSVLPKGMLREDYMKICLAMIDCADVVVFLSDWTESKGAMVEFEYCNYIGKKIIVDR